MKIYKVSRLVHESVDVQVDDDAPEEDILDIARELFAVDESVDIVEDDADWDIEEMP